MLLRNSFLFVFIAVVIAGCSCSSSEADKAPVALPEPDVFAYGYKLNNLEVVRDTVQSGDTFADIFLENGFDNSVSEILVVSLSTSSNRLLANANL